MKNAKSGHVKSPTGAKNGKKQFDANYTALKPPPQPWDIADLLPDDEDENIPKWKKYAKIILPHVGLIVLSLAYIVAGAAAFYYLERENELTTRRDNLLIIKTQRREFLENLWQLLNEETTTYSDYQASSAAGMDNITQVLFRAFDTHYVSTVHLTPATDTSSIYANASSAYVNASAAHDVVAHHADASTRRAVALDGSDNVDTWTFITAVFFTCTLLTTIGYGNLVPVTFEGRMFCICYGLFGVPLILITVADIGKFLSENIVIAYCYYVDVKTRWKTRLRQKRHTRGRSILMSTDPDQLLVLENNQECSNRDTETADASTSLRIDVEQAGGEEEEEEDRVRDELEKFGLEDYVAVPVTLILIILVGYITIGAVLLGSWEQWDFFTGFYFSFITMTTVGFGDIVPTIQRYYLLDLLYIIIGLAITTMCIDLVGIQYIRKIHYFGRAIEDARFALVNVGGKMVHVPDLMKYASVLQKKYGLRGAKGGPDSTADGLLDAWDGAYTPRDIRRIRYIDAYRASLSASCDSIQSYLSGCLKSARSSRSRTSATLNPYLSSCSAAAITDDYGAAASGNGSVYNIAEEAEDDDDEPDEVVQMEAAV